MQIQDERAATIASAHSDTVTRTSRMPDADAVGASYRLSMQREERIHAALGIPWQVSDGARSFLVLLPGLPRMDTGPVVPWASWRQDDVVRGAWNVSMMISWARDVLGFEATDIATSLGTTVMAVRRWSSGRSSPRGRHRAQLDLLQDFRALLAAAFVTPERAMTWLQTPPGLGYNDSPLMMVRLGAIRPLVAILESLESGAFR